jgi:hypothetical protein
VSGGTSPYVSTASCARIKALKLRLRALTSRRVWRILVLEQRQLGWGGRTRVWTWGEPGLWFPERRMPGPGALCWTGRRTECRSIGGAPETPAL